MNRWRIVLALLIAAALPLHGIAASSMLLCGSMAPRSAMRAGVPSPAPDVAAAAHAGHGATTAPASSAHDGHDRHDGAVDADGAASSDHGCPMCAAGCQGVALPEQSAPRTPHPFVQARTDCVPMTVLAASQARPDKPPRT